jgi:hypothetical protein
VRNAQLPTPSPRPGPLGFVRGRILGAPAVSRKRRALALTVALIADALQVVLWPAFAGGVVSPFDDVLDAVVALILLVTLGFSARLALALCMELVPGADMFPTWTAVVLSVPVLEQEPAQERGREPARDSAAYELKPLV